MTKEEQKKYRADYYKRHRKVLLKIAKAYYQKRKKKPAVCRLCGAEIKGAHGLTKYCKKCLNSPGHGLDAHRMASVRWFRKNHLTKTGQSDNI